MLRACKRLNGLTPSVAFLHVNSNQQLCVSGSCNGVACWQSARMAALPSCSLLLLLLLQREMVRQVNAEPRPQLVPSFGYVSLFPLLMQLLPGGSPELGQQLELLRDEALLWTPQGLRSLATTSSIYKK